MFLLREGEAMSDEAKCNCQQCGERIAFPPEMAGKDVTCPHCGRETTLILPQVKKADSDPNALVPRDESKSETSDATKILFGIIGIAVIAIPLFFFIHHQNEVAQAERNSRDLTNLEPTFVEQAKAEQAAFQAQQENIHWKATNGFADGEFEYATNLLSDHDSYLTNEALKWLQKAADQGYQPAIELLATHEPKSQLDSIDSFLWENRKTDLSETEEDFTSDYNPAVFNGERYITLDRTITIASGEIKLKAADKIHDENDRELTDLMASRADNEIFLEIGQEAQINPIFDKFLEWAATAKENNVENFEKQFLCTTNHFGHLLESAQAVRTYTFSWKDGQASLLVTDSSRGSVAMFSTEDIRSLQKLLLRLPQMKQKLATAIRNKEAQKNLFH